MDAETRELVLANRSYCWSFLARAFAGEPDAQFIGIIRSDEAREQFALLEDGCTERIYAIFSRISEAAGSADAERQLSQEYVDLFVGPAPLKAQPWESVQKTGRKALFQRSLLAVRESYRAAGFIPASYPRVADDFIGIECDFMGKLATEAWRCCRDGDLTRCGEMLDHAKSFLGEHLATWIPAFAQQLHDGYGDCFYADFADLLALQIERDQELLEYIDDVD